MDDDALADAYRAGATLAHIGEQLGLSPSTIWKRLRRHGVELRPRGPRPHPRPTCLRDGCDRPVTDLRFRHCSTSCATRARAAQPDPRIAELYLQGKSIRQTAAELDIARTTVLRHLRRLGVARRRSRS